MATLVTGAWKLHGMKSFCVNFRLANMNICLRSIDDSESTGGFSFVASSLENPWLCGSS